MSVGQLIQWSWLESYYALQIVLQLNALPLFVQITKIVGGVLVGFILLFQLFNSMFSLVLCLAVAPNAMNTCCCTHFTTLATFHRTSLSLEAAKRRATHRRITHKLMTMRRRLALVGKLNTRVDWFWSRRKVSTTATLFCWTSIHCIQALFKSSTFVSQQLIGVTKSR
jgi:hypothetical protein